MTEPLDPLDPDVMAVLARAKTTEPVPQGAGERIWAAVGARAALGPHGPSVATMATGPGTAPTGWVARHPFLAVGAGVAIGVVLGALARGGTDAAPMVAPVMSPVVTASAPPAPAPRASDWTESPHPAVPDPIPSAPEARAAPASLPPTGQQLAAESALLDLARTAIARGEAARAIAAVQRHETTFPQGMLREEREALAVKALVLGGHGDEARARAARFRARYPESLFLPALDSALKSLPGPLPDGTTDPKP